MRTRVELDFAALRLAPALIARPGPECCPRLVWQTRAPRAVVRRCCHRPSLSACCFRAISQRRYHRPCSSAPFPLDPSKADRFAWCSANRSAWRGSSFGFSLLISTSYRWQTQKQGRRCAVIYSCCASTSLAGCHHHAGAGDRSSSGTERDCQNSRAIRSN
jgi:hypothetical protein